MKLVARKPNWMEICFSGEDSYGNKSSRWASRSNPGDYLQFLDQHLLALDFSWYLTEDQSEESEETIRDYLIELDVSLPYEDLASFATFWLHDIGACYPNDNGESHYYEAECDIYLDGQQYEVVYDQEDLEMAVLRMYIKWKYQSKSGVTA